MSNPIYTTEVIKRVGWRADSTPPVEFTIHDPPEIVDWAEIEEAAAYKADIWARLIGYYSAHAKRESEIVELAQGKQRDDARKIPSVNQLERGNHA